MNILITLIRTMDWLARRFDATRGCRPSSSTESQATRQNRIMLSPEAERFHSVGKRNHCSLFGRGSKNRGICHIASNTMERLMCNVHQPRNVSRICFNVLRASVIQWSNIWCAPDMVRYCWEKWKRGREALRWLPDLERWTTGPES